MKEKAKKVKLNKCPGCVFWEPEACSFGICLNAKAGLSLNYANLTVLKTSSTFGCIYYKEPDRKPIKNKSI